MSNVTALRPEVDDPIDEVVSPIAGFEDVPPFMSPKTLAGILEVTPLTLQRWRDSKDDKGPAWSEIPGSNVIRYSRRDVLEWLAKHRVDRGVAS
ncbi:hypothetical protein MHM582_2089 [Microbacterium sp. HM58-2]|nr:hypothetical protein MHM582_2089 [Microbacterium sp. HM58-2]